MRMKLTGLENKVNVKNRRMQRREINLLIKFVMELNDNEDWSIEERYFGETNHMVGQDILLEQYKDKYDPGIELDLDSQLRKER